METFKPLATGGPRPGEAEARSVDGLTSAEATARLARFGPNTVGEVRESAWLRCARRFWGPLPWMLEATIALTVVLGKDLEAVIIAVLLVLNSVISFFQQSRSDEALRLLRQRLEITARVRRDGRWTQLPAHELVPGDVVRVRVGDLVPADLELIDGHLGLDQSSLTGESAPADAGPADSAFAATVVTRGEATSVVTATGASTSFGRTSALVATATGGTHLETVIFRIVRYLIVIDVFLVVVMFSFAAAIGTPLSETAPFALIILIASVPVVLPTTFTVAQAVGASELSRGGDEHHPGHGVLVTRLSAIQEAASMDVLCTDKTGTLTLNQLSVEDTVAYAPFTRDEVLELAAVASDESGQDPIDLALLRAATEADGASFERLAFVPFDPETKRTEATVVRGGELLQIIKGLPQVVADLCQEPPATMTADLDRVAATGARVLAVAAGEPGELRFVGLVALADRVRPDSAELVSELRSLGIDVKMITGDTTATAIAIAGQVGIEPAACTGTELRHQPDLANHRSVFAGVFPEDKYTLVRSLQDAGHVVGMTGDGVNDAPALKQAEVGIAVDNAVDVAKAAASMVLTEPGLVDTIAAVTVSRRIYQRMMTWTLNKIIKTAQVALFLTLAFILTRSFVTTPLLIVLLLLANDFVTMSLAVDHAWPSPRPERWRVRALVTASLAARDGRPRRIVPRPVARTKRVRPRPAPHPNRDLLDAGLQRTSHRLRRARTRAFLVQPARQAAAGRHDGRRHRRVRTRHHRCVHDVSISRLRRRGPRDRSAVHVRHGPREDRRAPTPRARRTEMTGTVCATHSVLPREMENTMTNPSTTISQNAALRSAARRLTTEFDGTFGTETIERLLANSYDQLNTRARVDAFLPLMAERFARERLHALARVEGREADDVPAVLFLCTHDAARSQMALGWLHHLAGTRATGWSSGTEPGSQVNPAAIAAMAEIGIDIAAEFPEPWTDELVNAADVVVAIGSDTDFPLAPDKRFEHWKLDDPADQDIAAIRPIRDDIGQRVKALLSSI